jgi:uncharacterized membrane protein required for colicin V production
MWWILDLIVVAIIALFVYLSAKRGFVRTVIELVGYFLAIYLSFIISGAIADFTYNKVVEPAIVENISNKISTTTNESVDSTVDIIWEALPEFVSKSAENFNVSKNSVKATVAEKYTSNLDTKDFVKTVAENSVKLIVVPLIKTICSVILFIILMFVVKILARVLNKMFSLPLIGGLNKALGGVIGLLKGVIFATIFVLVIMFIASFTENGFLIFTNENIDKTIIFKILAQAIPFK